MTRTRVGIGAFIFYVLTIWLANYVTVKWGFVSVGFGLMATAGTYAAGWSFVARNLVQESLGRKLVIVAIIAGAALSWFFASPTLALASGATFLVSETTDFLVYTPIKQRAKRRGWALAAICGNMCGAVVDTFLFLTLARFPLMANVPGQLVGKAYATVIFLIAGWMVRRAVLRQPVNATHP